LTKKFADAFAPQCVGIEGHRPGEQAFLQQATEADRQGDF
jgi:hypothetical protein